MGWGRLSPSLGMRENPSHRRVHGAWKMGAVSTFLRPSLLVMSPGCSFRGCLQKLPFQAWESRLRLGILSQCLSLQETLQNLPTEVLPNCHLPQAPWAAHSGLPGLEPTHLQSLPGSRLPENISQLVCTNKQLLVSASKPNLLEARVASCLEEETEDRKYKSHANSSIYYSATKFILE